jgi:hypothetical protein
VAVGSVEVVIWNKEPLMRFQMCLWKQGPFSSSTNSMNIVIINWVLFRAEYPFCLQTTMWELKATIIHFMQFCGVNAWNKYILHYIIHSHVLSSELFKRFWLNMVLGEFKFDLHLFSVSDCLRLTGCVTFTYFTEKLSIVQKVICNIKYRSH